MSEAGTTEATPFACEMGAIAPEERERHMETGAWLLGRVEEVREVENGYEVRLPNESEVLRKAAEFVANERLCCPFFGFGIELEAGGGPLWVRITGPEGVKPFIVAELGIGRGEC